MLRLRPLGHLSAVFIQYIRISGNATPRSEKYALFRRPNVGFKISRRLLACGSRLALIERIFLPDDNGGGRNKSGTLPPLRHMKQLRLRFDMKRSAFASHEARKPFAVANAREGVYSIAGNGVFLRGKERLCNMMTLMITVYLIGLLAWFLLLRFYSGSVLGFVLLGFLFLLLIALGLIISICYAVIKCVKKNTWKVRLASMIPFAASALALALPFLPFTFRERNLDAEVRDAHARFVEQRMAVIREIPREGPRFESVRVPDRRLSEDGEATVYRSDGKILVEFYVIRGMLCPSWSVVYTEKDTPPTEDELLSDGVEIRQELAPHWYFMHIR